MHGTVVDTLEVSSINLAVTILIELKEGLISHGLSLADHTTLSY
jgi:hypothetical protein